jgi:hypothetical protein
MSDLRISDIADLTGFSMRYWQRRASAGDIPGTRVVKLGERRTYLVDADKFSKWWRAQQEEVKPCQKIPGISGGGAVSGGIGSPRAGRHSRGRFKPQTLESLKNDLKVSVEN